MEAKEYIQRQLTSARRVADAATQETTAEQLNWIPSGTVNSIGAALLHVLAAEDSFIQKMVQARPMIWETGEWAEKIGVPIPPGMGKGWDELKSQPLTLAPLLAYQEAVRAATDVYLTHLTAAELDRQITMMGGQRPVADALSIMVVHIAYHAGEIAAVKGMQGLRGLPF
jgi:uncharacterized damage-inducible protein DinB